MEFLNIESGKIFPDRDLSEHFAQTSLDLEVARLRHSLKQDGILPDNFMQDLHLVARLQELLSEQELR